MTSILDQPLGNLVTETPAAARIFDGVGLDYCCRGRRTLSQACASAGVDAAAALRAWDTIDVETERERVAR